MDSYVLTMSKFAVKAGTLQFLINFFFISAVELLEYYRTTSF